MEAAAAWQAALDGDLDLVEVRWGDAWGDGDWSHQLPSEGHPALSLSVGYRVAEDEHGIVLVSLLNKHHGAYILVIPRGMILGVTRLKRSKRLT